MHMKPFLTVVLVPLLALSGSKTAEERAALRQATEQHVAQAVANRHLLIDIRSMDSQRYGSRYNLTDFTLELRGDTVVSNLPYLGRAYRASYGTPPKVLNFTAPIEHFQQERSKKNVVRITFLTQTDEDRYHYTIEVFPQGRCYIVVRPQERDLVSFDGELR